MIEKKYGIKELTEMVDLGLEFGMGIDRSSADGKFGMDDIGNFMPALMAVGPAFGGVKDIGKELADLDAEELVQLHAHVKQKFDLRDDEVEGYVEDGLGIAINIYNLVMKIMASRKRKNEEPKA